jgi:hypothetical protein
MSFYLLYTSKNLSPLFIFMCIPSKSWHTATHTDPKLLSPFLFLSSSYKMPSLSMQHTPHVTLEKAAASSYRPSVSTYHSRVSYPRRKKYLLTMSEQYVYFKVIPIHSRE